MLTLAPTQPLPLHSWSLRADLSDKVGAAFVTAGGMSAGEELVRVRVYCVQLGGCT